MLQEIEEVFRYMKTMFVKIVLVNTKSRANLSFYPEAL